MPHMRSPPQPSDTGPQLAIALAHVRGTHRPAPPHWLAVPPPPQVCGAAQVPHMRSPPQPSDTGPQLAITLAQVRRTQLLPASIGVVAEPHTLGTPAPPQL